MKASFKSMVGRLLLRWLPSRLLAQSARLSARAVSGAYRLAAVALDGKGL